MTSEAWLIWSWLCIGVTGLSGLVLVAWEPLRWASSFAASCFLGRPPARRFIRLSLFELLLWNDAPRIPNILPAPAPIPAHCLHLQWGRLSARYWVWSLPSERWGPGTSWSDSGLAVRPPGPPSDAGPLPPLVHVHMAQRLCRSLSCATVYSKRKDSVDCLILFS